MQRRISDYKANKVLSMDRESLRNEVKVSDGTRKPVSIDGIEVELEWDNPHSMIVSHFWIDPKIRKNGIGTEIADETFKQTKEIDRIKEIYVTMQSADGATKRFLKKLKFDKLVEYEDDYWGNMVEGRLYLD